MTICGTDLHILKGDVPEVDRLGSSATRRSARSRVGDGVTTVYPGDRVLISCISGCGTLRYCREGHYGQCPRRRLDLGHLDRRRPGRVRPGAVRGHVRLPAPRALPDERCCSPTSSRPRSRSASQRRVKPGDTVVIVGAGPIGLAAVITAQALLARAHHRHRLAPARARAREFGADPSRRTRRGRRRKARADRTGSGPTSSSRRSAPGDVRALHQPRPARRPCRPSASTASRRRSTWSALDPTSPSLPVWSTPRPRRGC